MFCETEREQAVVVAAITVHLSTHQKSVAPVCRTVPHIGPNGNFHVGSVDGVRLADSNVKRGRPIAEIAAREVLHIIRDLPAKWSGHTCLSS